MLGSQPDVVHSPAVAEGGLAALVDDRERGDQKWRRSRLVLGRREMTMAKDARSRVEPY